MTVSPPIRATLPASFLASAGSSSAQFGEWAMGYAAGDEGAAGDDLSATVAALVAPLDDPNLRAQFLGFAQIQSDAA